jgi:hypothetical protein
MRIDALGEHAMWLMTYRKTATDDSFIERLSALVIETADCTVMRKTPARPDERDAFLLEYATLRGKWGAFKALLKKYDVKEGTARKWISDAGMTK